MLGKQGGKGVWTGPVHPNKTKLQDDDKGCGDDGCLFDIAADPTEHADLAAAQPQLLKAPPRPDSHPPTHPHNPSQPKPPAHSFTQALRAKLDAAAASAFQTGADGYKGPYTNCTTLAKFVKVYPGFGGPLCTRPTHD